MFSHLTVGSNDIARAKAFYDATLAPLGLSAQLSFPDGIGYGLAGKKPQFWVVRPLDKQAASAGNGTTVGLEADNRAAVDQAHAAALAQGGKDEGAPGLRKHYHPNYYGAYVRDPEGHKLCIVCHRPE